MDLAAFYACDFTGRLRLGLFSFCSCSRRPLRGVSDYIGWQAWSTVPYMLADAQKEVSLTPACVCFLRRNYWSSHGNCDALPRGASQRTVLCREDKTSFTVKASPHPQMGHQDSLFSHLYYSFIKTKKALTPVKRYLGWRRRYVEKSGGCFQLISLLK